jgi:hypothetical protein
MKKEPDKKKTDNVQKLIIRNWIICIISLALAVICYYYVK